MVEIVDEPESSLETLMGDLSISSIERWLKSLPKGQENVAQAGEQLFAMMNSLGNQDISGGDLLTYLEAIRSTLYRLIKTLTIHYHDQDSNLSPESEPLIKTSLMLLAAGTAAYTSVISRLDESASKYQKHQALHRALSGQLYLQVTYYQLHLAIPGKEWIRLHQLFQMAVKNKGIDFALNDEDLFTGNKCSIKDIYCIALMLGCSRVNHLSPKQVLTVSSYLQAWAHMISLSKTPDPDSQLQIVADVTSGLSPSIHSGPVDGDKQLFYLQIAKLVGHLDEIIAFKETGKKPDEVDGGAGFGHLGQIDARLVSYLKSAWSEYVYREKRQKTDQKTRVAIGIKNVHYFLCGGESLKGFVGEKLSFSIVYEEDEDQSIIESQRSGDVWSSFLSEPDGDLITDEIPARANFQMHFSEQDGEQPPEEGYSALELKMVDKSDHGCRLEWSSENVQQADVGEFLAIKTDDCEHWQVAEIRWIEHTGKGVSYSGVRILSKEAIPVALDVPLRLGVGENYVEAILFPPESGYLDQTSLVLSPLGLKQEEFVEISQKGIVEKVKLIEVASKTENFIRFAIGFTQNEPKPTTTTPRST